MDTPFSEGLGIHTLRIGNRESLGGSLLVQVAGVQWPHFTHNLPSNHLRLSKQHWNPQTLGEIDVGPQVASNNLACSKARWCHLLGTSSPAQAKEQKLVKPEKDLCLGLRAPRISGT